MFSLSSAIASTSTTAVASTSSTSSAIPDEWKWVKDIMDEAHLPHLGLPVRWDKTREKQIQTAFDPVTKQSIDITSGDKKKFDKSPVNFIEGTQGVNPMPGSQTPAAVRLTRYMEPCLHDKIIKDASGNELVPCIAHGDYVKVEALQADHLQAKETIKMRQQKLVEKLNSDPAFASAVMALDGINKFFVKVDGQYYGTLFFYELYFNDIDNIWLICQACNLQKSNHDTLEWLQEQWLYGDEFLDYLGKVKDEGILVKAKAKEGLAQIAINWFWDRHAHYACIAKELMKNVVTPIQILNQRVDRVVGLSKASGNEKRVQRYMASLDFRVALLSTTAQMKGIDMPKTASESPHSSSDETGYLDVKDNTGNRLVPTIQEYQETTKSVIQELPGSVLTLFAKKIQEKRTQTQTQIKTDDDDENDDDEGLSSKKIKLTE